MKQKQYKTPLLSIVEIKVESLLSGESIGVNSTNKVTSDESVFSRSDHSDWSDSDE